MKLGYNKKASEILIFCMLFFAGTYFYHPVTYDNMSSRYFLVSSIVDFGTLSIDQYHDRTIDKSFSNGHYYSNKAIGAPLLGIPVYWILRNFTPSGNRAPLSSSDKYFVRVFTTTLPFAILGVVLFRTACLIGASFKIALLMALAYSFGSIALIHSVTFTGHQVAGSFAFFSFYILFKLSNQNKGEVKKNLSYQITKSFLAGLFAGLAALADYTAMFIAIALTVYVFSLRLSWRLTISFLSGGGLMAVVLAAYNYYCFGSPWSMSYAHLTHEAFQEGSSKGILGISVPDPFALFSILMSPSRGLFFIMPVFIFSLFGLKYLWTSGKFRREILLIVVIVAGYLFINAGFYAWHGGWTFGPRYLVPMLPFLALPMVYANPGSFWFYLLFAISMFQVFPAVISIPHVPEIIQNPLTEIILPCLGYGYMAVNGGHWLGLNGLWSLIPFFTIMLGIAVFMFWSVDSKDRYDVVPLAWKASIGLSIAFILLTLATVHTKPPELLHQQRAVILRHGALATQSEQLSRMAAYEKRLAEKERKSKK